MAFPKKPKKPVAPWRENILSHHTSKPSRADRAEFPRQVIQQLIERAGGRCEACKQREDTETHHVMPKGGRSGRGVFSNGLRVCRICHHEIQTNEDKLQYWIEVFRQRHGERFWYDETDHEEYNKRQAAEQEAEEIKTQRINAIKPIVALLSTAAGRKLNSKELRLISEMDALEVDVFTKLMRDIVASEVGKQSFGYGERFED